MRHHLVRLAAALALALAAAGCTHAAAATATDPAAGRVGTARARAGASSEGDLATAQADRLLVRRASLGVEVKAVEPARAAAAAFAARAGGYVQSVSASEDRASLRLRVPAPGLDAALDSLARLGHETSRVVSAEDVTEESVDLDARAANLRALRDRLRQHLERATTVADVVAVERELARVQSELDALEARRKVLRTSVALAELNVELTRRPVLGPLGLLLAGTGRLIGKLFVWR